LRECAWVPKQNCQQYQSDDAPRGNSTHYDEVRVYWIHGCLDVADYGAFPRELRPSFSTHPDPASV
jgi:hypothetical protein